MRDIGDVRLALDGAFETAVPQTADAVPAASAPSRARTCRVGARDSLSRRCVAIALAVPAVLYLRAPRSGRHAGALQRSPLRLAPSAPSQRRACCRDTRRPDARLCRQERGRRVAHLCPAPRRGGGATGRRHGRAQRVPSGPPMAGRSASPKRAVSIASRSTGAPRAGCATCPAAAFRGGTWGARGVIVFALDREWTAAGARHGRHADAGDDAGRGGKGSRARSRRGFFRMAGTCCFWRWPEGQTRGTIWATAIDDPARTRIVESSGGAAYAAGWLLSTTATPRSLVAQPFDPERLTLQGTPQPIRDRLPGANTGGYPGFAVSSSGVLVVDRPPPTRVSTDVDGPQRARTGDGEPAGEPQRVRARAGRASRRRRDAIRRTRPRHATSGCSMGSARDGTRLTYEGGTSRPLWALDGRHIYFTRDQRSRSRSDARHRRDGADGVRASAARSYISRMSPGMAATSSSGR